MKDFIHKKALLGVIVLLVLLNVGIWYGVWKKEHPVLFVAFLDIGQGDSIFIRAPSGREMLVDGGSGAQVLRALSEVMPPWDRTIDVVVGTHPDADHIGGLSDVLSHYHVHYVFEPGLLSDTITYQAFTNAVEKEVTDGAVHAFLERGMQIDLGRGAVFTVLWPDGKPPEGTESNSASIVGRLSYKKAAVMLTGDAPQSVEKVIVGENAPSVLQSDILKLGHHGSKTSSSEVWLEAVAPSVAVVSAGENNRYGHPHQEVLDRLLSDAIPVVRTDKEGTLRYETIGETWLRKKNPLLGFLSW